MLNQSFKDISPKHYHSLHLSDLEDIIGYKFKNKGILISAITHKSMQQFKEQNETFYHYERLEYLGDSIHKYFVVSRIYEERQKEIQSDEHRVRSIEKL